MVDEHRVELGARWMALGHVQGLEVEPVGLYLGSLGDREPEADEDILETLPCLRHGMTVTAPRGRHELGEVEPFGGDARVTLLGGEHRAPILERRGDRFGRRVERASSGLALLGARQRAEPALEHRQGASLAEDFLVDAHDLVERGSI